LPRLLARKDGKIIVVARSKASAKRRGNLAKSLGDGREGLPRRLARKDTGGEIATPAGSQGHGGERLPRRLARNDGKPAGSQ